MSSPTPETRELDAALWLSVLLGIVGNSYFLAAWSGSCVTSACGLAWPTTTMLLLVGIIGLAGAIAQRDSSALPYMAGGAVFLIALVILNLLPPFARDELTHHLAIPDLYLASGRAVTVPFAEQSFFPMQLTLLYTPLLAQGWETLPKQLHLLYGLGSISILYMYLAAHVPLSIAAFAALLLLTTPTFATLASSAYVDLGLFFFTAVSIVALLRWSETNRTSFVAIAGFAAGCAGAIKYNGYLTIAIALLGCVALAPRRNAASVIRGLLIFGCLAVLPLLPWLLRNFLETGNPMFPMFRGLLGGPPRAADTPGVDIFTKRRFLYGESWFEVLTTPFRAFVLGRHGNPARFDGVFNPLFLLGFAAIFIGRRSEKKRFLWLFSLTILVMVFVLTTFRSRYAIAALAPLTILAAFVLSDWQARSPRAQTAVSFIGIAAICFNLGHFADYWISISPTPYLSGEENRTQFITRFVPEYPLAEFADKTLGPDSNVYLAFLGQRGFYWNRKYTYDYYYSGTSLRDAVRLASTPEQVSSSLRDQGISHIAASAPLLGRYLNEDLTEVEMARWNSFASRHLRLLRTHGAFGLYEII